MDVLAEQILGYKTIKETGLPHNSPAELLRAASLFKISRSMDEFARTGDQELLDSIVEAVLAYSRRANRLFVADDFMWNDHAISSRTLVLSRLWRLYRRSENYSPHVAREIFEHVARNIKYLMRGDHFTYWTNHGVMQSIALLHAANSFPILPGREEMIDLALKRLTDQLIYFVSDRGWIMEHSAGYQEFGVNLLGTLIVEVELLDRTIPSSWRNKYIQAKRVLELLRRPDGSIPNYGSSNFNAEKSIGSSSA